MAGAERASMWAELAFVHKDGRSIPLLLLDRHLKDARGQIVGIRTVFAPVVLEP